MSLVFFPPEAGFPGKLLVSGLVFLDLGIAESLTTRGRWFFISFWLF
jgi:hypothetical protein